MPYQIKSERVSGVDYKIFREGGKRHYNVRIYLEATWGDSLDKVRSFTYELHPTFRQRIHVSEIVDNQFEIRIWTYGYFNTKATLRMRDDTLQEIQGFVKW